MSVVRVLRHRRVVRLACVGIAVAAMFGSVTAGGSAAATAHSAAASAVSASAPVVSGHPADGVLNQGRRTLDFDSGWKFKLVNTADTVDPSGIYGNSADPHAAAADFNDAAWSSVTLPHDWSIEQLPDATNSNSTGYFPGGLGWYRKTFTAPRSMAGKRLSVDFDGVYMNSYVYLNGQLLGNHPYGYTGFTFDISKLVHADGATPNVLAVVVQNKQPSSRWYSGSGITRNVHLTVTDPVHVARDGTFVTTPTVADTIGSGFADAHVQTTVQNDSGAVERVRVISTIKNAEGGVVASDRSGPLTIGGSAATAVADVKVKHPHLWSTTDPYLYTLQTRVVVGQHTTDTYTTTFGIRWLIFSPDGGISLNGQHLKLQGVDLHQDQGALGSVDNYDALWRQMSILKSEGVNAFRTSHNPPSPEMIDVCQRLGIVMMVEAFDAWNVGKTANDYHLYFDEWSHSDITEMVNEAKNSPAVVMWSIGNEIPNWWSADALPIEKRLIADIKGIDTSRPVVAGSDQYRSVPKAGSVLARMAENLDGLGLNYDPALAVDGLHAMFPTKFFFESESSSETSARGVYQDPELLNTGENYTPGKRLTSSYDNNLASWTMSNEYGLKKDRDRRYFAGQFIWSGFDYIGEPTPYSVFPVKVSAFGTVDTAGLMKDAYYLFQSQWTSKPMVHIVPMNWTNYEPGQGVQVEVYSNVKTVQLFLNGKSLGTKSFDAKTSTDGTNYLETTTCTNDDKNYTGGRCPGSYESPNGSSGNLHLTWNVPFHRGKLVAVATDGAGRQVARDVQQSAGKPATVTLRPDKTVLQADGKSLSYFTARVVDAKGATVPNADNPLTFKVTGAGTFQGADNGKQDDAEGYKPATHTAFNGKEIVIAESMAGKAGPITLTATGDDLAPTTSTIYSVNKNARGLVGIAPIHTRTAQGSRPTLPQTVTAVYADGSTHAVPVHWQQPRGRLALGVHTVSGTVAGLHSVAHAVVSVYQARTVAPYSSVVPVGTPPGLPTTVLVTDSDGVRHHARVSWAAVKRPQYATPGRFTVLGQVARTSLPARAVIQVTAHFTPGANIAASTSPTRPSADAGYSGAPSEVPAGMLDGTATSGGWSNYYVKSATNALPAVSVAHAKEWVSVSWAGSQHLTSVIPYFTIADNRVLPASVDVSYWTGSTWKPVRNQQTTLATASDQPSSITFDPVSTTKLRLDMTSPAPNTATGFMQITELQVPADEVTAT